MFSQYFKSPESIDILVSRILVLGLILIGFLSLFARYLFQLKYKHYCIHCKKPIIKDHLGNWKHVEDGFMTCKQDWLNMVNNPENYKPSDWSKIATPYPKKATPK